MSQTQRPHSSFPEVRIVEASAGSGKTYALAKRYIKLLINPGLAISQIPLNSILAITFTNKACREMKERIIMFLKQLHLDIFVSAEAKQEFLSYLEVSEDVAREKAGMILDYIIDNYNYFQVQTIDSFINIILSSCALQLKLSANFRIKDNHIEYLKYSLDECIEKSASDKHTAKLFDNFLKQYLYIENKSSWFAKNDILEILKNLFNGITVYGDDFKRVNIKPLEIIKQKNHVYSLLEDLNSRLPAEKTDKRFKKALENFLRNSDKAFDLGNLSSAYFEKDSLPMNKSYSASPLLSKTWKKIKTEIIAISEQEAMSLFDCYIDIFELVYSDLKEISRVNDMLFLNELNQQASYLFRRGNLSLAELYYRLASRLKHYLIDEFQDTSRLQWSNLRPMVEEALSSEGSLFYVGDKKQAIYRFRGGEVTLFDELQHTFKSFKPIKTKLQKNFRSQKQIVLFNNQVFSESNLRRFINLKQKKEKNSARFFTDADIGRILKTFVNSKQELPDGQNRGFVKAEFIDCNDNDEKESKTKDKTIRLLKELNGRFAPSDIAVLCRSNQEIELVTGWLIEEGIDVESERTLNIKNNGLIKELIALLRFLDHPIDNLSFAAFLSGKIFCRRSKLENKKIQEFLFSLRDSFKNDKSFYLYRHFQKAYPELWSTLLAEFYKNAGLMPLYELVTSIIEKLSILKNFPKEQGFVMRFIELIKKEEEEHSSISDFLDFIDEVPEQELYVDFSGENAVKLLTIHKAKGLGFDVVILPFLEVSAVTRGNRMNHVVHHDLIKRELSLLRLDGKYIRFSRKLRNIYHEEYLRSFIDELNTLYVSFTRAKQELYIFIPKPASRQINIAVNLIPESYMCCGELPHNKATAKKKPNQIFSVPVATYKGWIGFLKEEFITKSELKYKQQIQSGRFMHAVLSHINNLKGVDFTNVLNKAVREAEKEYPFYDNAESCVKIVTALLKDKSTKEMFYPDKATIFTEKEVVDGSGNSKRIDRMIIREKEVWIIDYKSGEEDSQKHAAQIIEYKDLIASLYPAHIIRGFLVYIDKIKIEEVTNSKS